MVKSIERSGGSLFLFHFLNLNPDLWRDTMVLAFENLTHHSIRSGVEKVLSVWETRQVFDKDAVEKMRHIIATAKSAHKGFFTLLF